MKRIFSLLIPSGLALASSIAHADSVILNCVYNGAVQGTVRVDYDANVVTESWGGLGADTVPAIITNTTIA